MSNQTGKSKQVKSIIPDCTLYIVNYSLFLLAPTMTGDTNFFLAVAKRLQVGMFGIASLDVANNQLHIPADSKSPPIPIGPCRRLERGRKQVKLVQG